MKVDITLSHGAKCSRLSLEYSSWEEAVRDMVAADPVRVIDASGEDGQFYYRSMLGICAERLAERDGVHGDWRN